jgi:hypothetical protein
MICNNAKKCSATNCIHRFEHNWYLICKDIGCGWFKNSICVEDIQKSKTEKSDG